MAIRTRFAPSPTSVTGGLHIGGLRTALYNYLYAKQNGGSFIIRIEDTDEKRSSEVSEKAILDDLKWAGLTWDEGPGKPSKYGPYYQSERQDIYNKYIVELLRNGHAYEKEDHKEPGKVAIYFKMPKKTWKFSDIALGTLILPSCDCEDFVIRKSSGMPSFYFASAIDDYTMEISHVIRAHEHINTTYRQIALLEILGMDRPQYCHIPLVMNENGKKMSKRQKDGLVNVCDFRKKGFTSEAILSYIASCGFNFGQDNLTLQRMESKFHLGGVTNSSARFSYRKLLFCNKTYIADLSLIDLEEKFLEYCELMDEQNNIDLAQEIQINRISECLAICQKWNGSNDTLENMYKTATTILKNKIGPYNTEYLKESVIKDKHLMPLSFVMDKFSIIDDWTAENILKAIKECVGLCGLSMTDTCQSIRVAVMNCVVTPPIDVTLEVIGKDITIERIQNCITECVKTIEAKEEQSLVVV